ncbi:MAG: PBP1A family penicillin-binding protein [Nitrospirae bacterium]|nr:PBP1A family penicillin-binding protein [Nitrospirota bacterium]
MTARRRSRLKKWLSALAALFLLFLLGGGAFAFFYYQATRDLPPVKALREYKPSLVSRIYSNDGRVVGEFFVEKRVLVPLSTIPLYLRQAVISAEDDSFYKHSGIDYPGIVRAFVVNLMAMEIKQGGSTITQQLARSLFLTPERHFMRKLKEAILARRIEQVLSKDQILEIYLNQIYFGRGAYGVQSAAFTYFDKDISKLSLSESALLAGMIRSPGGYSPYNRPEESKLRQKSVLKRMLEERYITKAQFTKAYQQNLYLKKPLKEEDLGPYFLEYIRQDVVAKYGAQQLYRGGLNVFTTMDYDMQMAATHALKEGLRAVDKRRGYRGPIRHKSLVEVAEERAGRSGALAPSEILAGDIVEGTVTRVSEDSALVAVGALTGRIKMADMAWAKKQLKGANFTDIRYLPEEATARKILAPGDVVLVRVKSLGKGIEPAVFSLEQYPMVEGALVSLDPASGAIKAMVGGFDFRRSEFNRAIQSKRQPGSAFKPIVYGAALDQGLTPVTMFDDAPISYDIPGWDKPWMPENYDKKFYGPITLREALTFSRNVVTVKLVENIGIDRVINFARTLGIKSPLERNLSLSLGSSGLSLMELTSAYGVYANQGIGIEPMPLYSITNASGKILEQHFPQGSQAISPQTAYLITNMMEDVIQKGTGRGARVFGRPLAGKTGTTNDFTDAWFIGFTPNIVTGVWVGFDSIQSIGDRETGARAALPIWINYMQEAFKKVPEQPFSIPEEIVFLKVDPNDGLLASPTALDFTVEVFRQGTEPTSFSRPAFLQPPRRGRYIGEEDVID